MPRLVHAVPKYRKHRASGQAIVSISGHDHYLGPHGTKASKMLYDRLIAEFLSADRRPMSVPETASGISVVEVLAAFWRHCKSYYVKNGKCTNEVDAFKLIIRDIRRLYGDQAAEQFGPKALKAVRQQWIDRGQSRPTVNKNMRRLTRIFKWAVSEELIPPTVHQALSTVPGLKKGRCDVPEPAPIEPVDLKVVERTISDLPRIVASMVRLQLLTGMRPGEVCILRPCDIDRSGDVWEYKPDSHKTEHHGRFRIIFIGPEAQAVLSPYLLRDSTSHCFSPSDNMKEYLAAKHGQRRVPLSCGNRPGTNRQSAPKKQPGNRYDPGSYRRVIHRACDRAFQPPESLQKCDDETIKQWHSRLTAVQLKELKAWQSAQRWSPNQLRHTAATTIRKKFGLEAAQVILGHAAADVTQVYAERDADKARDVARQIG
jgi:integrase